METTPPPPAEGAPLAPDRLTAVPRAALERLPFTVVDRWLPARAGPFVAVVIAISAGIWVAGLAMATERERFVASDDWRVQPLFFAAHLVMLRLFVTAYARGFLEGCRYLKIERAEAERRVRQALGPMSWIAALVLAAPFVWNDLGYLVGTEYSAGGTQGRDGALGATDWLTGAIWTVEWIVNAYVWTVILGFLALTMRVLKEYPFREDLEVVLGERHYRPFLLMSAQGATIVLLFSLVNAFYVWSLTEPEWTDWLGLTITIGLLIVGFVPPWMRLKNGIAKLARAEADRLNRGVRDGWRSVAATSQTAATEAGLVARLNQLLVLARAGHLERLWRDFGRNEGQAMIIRLLAPLATVVWKFFRPG